MGAGASSRERKPISTDGGAGTRPETDAMEILRQIEAGTYCLAGGSHSWVSHEGTMGKGRACEKCFSVEDTRCKPARCIFRIQPVCKDPAPTAASVLELWENELRRCRDGGCIAGGDHEWVDVRKTLVRLTGEGRCCAKCGMVTSMVTPLEAALGAANATLLLPQLLGVFGPAVPTEYRSMYGGSGAVQVNTAT